MAERNAVYPINDPGEFKAWKLQNPNAAKLLDVITFRWRVASARVRGDPSKWAAFPAEQWCEWSKLSRDQFKRALRLLEQDRLIVRERHRFAGSKVYAFLQPTVLSLTYLGKESDFTRLGKSCLPAPKLANAPSNAPTGALTDYTTTPTNSNLLQDTKVCDHPSGIAPKKLNFRKFSGEKEGKGMGDQGLQTKGDTQGLPQPLKNDPPVIWESGHKACYPDSFIALSAINRKQLKDFVSKCPAGYGGNVLEHTVLNWGEFRLLAMSDEGAFMLPLRPAVGVLLKFIASAVKQWLNDLGLTYVDGKVQPVMSLQFNPSVAATPIPVPETLAVPEKQKPATPDEWKTILFGTDD